MDGRQLRKLFADLNGQYFGGRLPQYRIHVCRIGSSGFCNWRRRVITIAPEGDQTTQRDTLIHEMVHAATKCGHSPKFYAELGRLKTLGLSIPEASQDTDGPKPRLKKDYFVNEAKDALASDREIAYADVVRKINCEYGYADSVSAFNRHYPWAKRAFRIAINEITIYQKQVEAMRKKMIADD